MRNPPGALIAIGLFAAAAGCAPANYNYSFALTDPGAVNAIKPGQRDVLEDADIKTEILVDPTSFQAILYDLTNKTDQPIQVDWANVVVVTPDGNQMSVRPDGSVGGIDPGMKQVVRLVPFSLPSQGQLAAAYEAQQFQLVVRMWVRGASRELRYHLVAHVNKI
jgi:hypothetical protein